MYTVGKIVKIQWGALKKTRVAVGTNESLLGCLTVRSRMMRSMRSCLPARGDPGAETRQQTKSIAAL
jgi:hypothetical protein